MHGSIDLTHPAVITQNWEMKGFKMEERFTEGFCTSD